MESNTEPNSPKIDVLIRQVDPRSLTLLDEGKNARYMTGQQQERLTNNLKNDGALTSVPLVYADSGSLRDRIRSGEGAEDTVIEPQDGEHLIVLSGNHRVMSAVQADLMCIFVMVVMTEMTEQERIALQLSHNAIVGQDDPSLLYQLYAGLDLEAKLYSGLDDDHFAHLTEVDIDGLSIGSIQYEELIFTFLPEDKEGVLEFMKELDEVGRSSYPERHAAPYQIFHELFDTIVAVKREYNVHNSAVALSLLVELAQQKLEELKVDVDGTESGSEADKESSAAVAD